MFHYFSLDVFPLDLCVVCFHVTCLFTKPTAHMAWENYHFLDYPGNCFSLSSLLDPFYLDLISSLIVFTPQFW